MSAQRILIAYNDSAICQMYRIMLEVKGYDVATCDNGEECLSMALDFRPHIVIVGILIPKVSGIDVVDVLRNTPETEDVLSVVLSTFENQTFFDRAKAVGADDILAMADNAPRQVVDRIEELLEQRYPAK